MIRVIVELHPATGSKPYRLLGTIDISNVRDLGSMADYRVELNASAVDRKTNANDSVETRAEDGAVRVESLVLSHRRDDGWERLVERALRVVGRDILRVRAPSPAVCDEALSALHEMFAALGPAKRAQHEGDFDDVERLLQWTRLHGPAYDEASELTRLRDVIRTGGARYRLERAVMGFPGGQDDELATCKSCGERAIGLEPYCAGHRPASSGVDRIRERATTMTDEESARTILDLDDARIAAIQALSSMEWLSSAEWSSGPYGYERMCPSCSAQEPTDHHPHCLLDKALKACRKAASSAEEA